MLGLVEFEVAHNMEGEGTNIRRDDDDDDELGPWCLM
jgi:hypothetical protein